MKATIKCTAFNGTLCACTLELYLRGLPVVLNEDDAPEKDVYKNSGLPVGIASAAHEKILHVLQKAFPRHPVPACRFMVECKQFELLKARSMQPDADQLADAVAALTLSAIADTLDTATTMPDVWQNHDLDRVFTQALAASETAFEHLFIRPAPADPRLEQAWSLLRERLFDRAAAIMAEIGEPSANQRNRALHDRIAFLLALHRRDNDDALEQRFRDLLEQYAPYAAIQVQLYFDYIKHLQDIRDDRRPRQLALEFEKRFSPDVLLPADLALFHYLKGRGRYYRGDYLEALRLLCQALEGTPPEQERDRARIFNTAANAFTDNLFYDEALALAHAALTIRERLSLAEHSDTCGLIAGIHFRRGAFNEARTWWEKQRDAAVEKPDNRLLNNLAKCAMMLDDRDAAANLLDQAREQGDERGFTAALELRLLVMNKEVEKAEARFKATFMLPENKTRFDDFAVAWAYVAMAQCDMDRGKYRDATKRLTKAQTLFLADAYVFEAACVALLLPASGASESDWAYYEEIQPKPDVIERLQEYVAAHSELAVMFMPRLLPDVAPTLPENARISQVREAILQVWEYDAETGARTSAARDALRHIYLF